MWISTQLKVVPLCYSKGQKKATYYNFSHIKKNNKMSNLTFKVGEEVRYNNCFGINVITEINGKTATCYEKNSGLTYKKRLSSLQKYEGYKESIWGEQELMAGQAVHKHGDTVYTCLSGDGNGCKMIWDDKQKQCVDSKLFVY